MSGRPEVDLTLVRKMRFARQMDNCEIESQTLRKRSGLSLLA
jgi:hypothetical protein